MASKSKNGFRNFKENLVDFHRYLVLYAVLIQCIVFVLCSEIIAIEATQAQDVIFSKKLSSDCNFDKNPSCGKLQVNRIPRQKPSESLMGLINWLFGPPATDKSQVVVHAAENSSINFENLAAKAEPKITSLNAAEDHISLNGDLGSGTPSRNNSLMFKNDSAYNQFRDQNKKSIEITDIQPSIGTELHSYQVKSDSAQNNLKDDLFLVEKFDQSVQKRPTIQLKSGSSGRMGRLKRDYKPIKVPYTSTKSNDLSNNILGRRQLLVSPFDQQVMALQQQQQAVAAAAAMLHKQQMDSLLNANHRYSVLDDYDREDDEESDEESEEFDDFTSFGAPLIEHHHMYLRDGLLPQVPVPPFQRKLGWGLRRRSVTDKKSKPQRKLENGEAQRGRVRTSNLNKGLRKKDRKYKNRASLKNGQWFLDDYDLYSDFHDNPEQMKTAHERASYRIDGPELDEEEHYERYQKNESVVAGQEKEQALRRRGDINYIYRKFRDSLCQGKECLKPRLSSTNQLTSVTDESAEETTTPADDTAGNSSESPTTITSEGSTSEGSSTSESSTSDNGSTDESSTSQESTPPEELTTPGGEVTTEEATTSEGGTTPEGSTNSDGSTTEEYATTTEVSGSTTTKPKPPYKATLNCRCGTQSVIGGTVGDNTVARFNANPWLVAISNESAHMCSGSIINDRYILTSKSCVRDVPPNVLNIAAGLTSNNLRNFSVSKIIINRNVNIALLQLKTKIKPSQSMRPVCLPIGKRYAGNYSTGTLITFKRASPKLQVVDTEVSILGNGHPKCKSKDKGTFCTGPPGSMKCGGDTGGNLVVYRGGYSYEQIGVVAGTVGCRASNTPGVHTDIRKRTRWILNNSKEGNYCKSPPVTDDDLMSATRVGDPYFELNEDFEDTSEFEKNDFADDDDTGNVNISL